MRDEPLTDVVSRLRRLVDERAILATLTSYGHAIDYGDEARWLSCFTVDGVFDVRRRLEPERRDRHEGRTALAAFIDNHTRAPGAWHKHLLVEPDIRVDGDRATSDSYFLRVDHVRDRPRIVAMGRYRDRLVRCDDGEWRIRERIAEVEGAAGPRARQSRPSPVGTGVLSGCPWTTAQHDDDG